jgi:hypothetical protein
VKKYIPEQKEAALARLRAGEPEQKVADALGIPRGTISAWRRRETKSTAALVESEGPVEGEIVDEPPTTTELWERARAGLAKTAQGIIETGEALIALRDLIDRGKWQASVERELAITVRTAEYYIAVAESEGIKEAKRVSPYLLPGSLRAMAVLSRTTKDEMQYMVSHGEIRPGLTGKTAEQAVERAQQKLSGEAPEPADQDDQDPGEEAPKPEPRLCGASLRDILDKLEMAHLSYDRFTEDALINEAGTYSRQAEVARMLRGHSDWIAEAAELLEKYEE